MKQNKAKRPITHCNQFIGLHSRPYWVCKVVKQNLRPFQKSLFHIFTLALTLTSPGNIMVHDKHSKHNLLQYSFDFCCLLSIKQTFSVNKQDNENLINTYSMIISAAIFTNMISNCSGSYYLDRISLPDFSLIFLYQFPANTNRTRAGSIIKQTR